MPGDGLGAEKLALEVRVQRPVIQLFRHIEKRLGNVNARVVHQNVDPAELVEHTGDHRVDFGLLRHVRLNEHRPPTHGLDGTDGVLASVRVDIADGHVRALSGERLDNRPSDPAAAPGDKCESVLKPSAHDSSSRFKTITNRPRRTAPTAPSSNISRDSYN